MSQNEKFLKSNYDLNQTYGIVLTQNQDTKSLDLELKTREKLCIWKMKKKCWRRFDRVMVTNLFAQTILDKIFGGNKMKSSKIGQD